MRDVQIDDKPRPRYAVLAQQLETDIATGRYPVDSYLPTEAKLCDVYAVSRFTVREAMRRLQGLGLISRHQGIGTRVIAERPDHGYTHSTSSVDELLQYAVETQLAETEIREIETDEKLAAELRCAVGQRYLHIQGLRVSADGTSDTPVSATDVYVLAKYKDIGKYIPGHHGAIANLIQSMFGESVREVQQEIDAVLIDAELAEKLGVEAGMPALRTHRWFLGHDGTPFEISISTHPAKRYRYAMRLRRDAT